MSKLNRSGLAALLGSISMTLMYIADLPAVLYVLGFVLTMVGVVCLCWEPERVGADLIEKMMRDSLKNRGGK